MPPVPAGSVTFWGANPAMRPAKPGGAGGFRESELSHRALGFLKRRLLRAGFDSGYAAAGA